MSKTVLQPHESAFRIINPATLYDPTAFAYSHLVEVKNFNRIIHIAGQGGENIQADLSADFLDQLQQTWLNISNALDAVNSSFSDIAVLRILIVEHNSEKHQLLIQEMNRIWKNHTFPACTLIAVPCLAINGMLIEIEATAYCS